MYHVYIIENEQGWHYIGSTSDLEARLRRHNQNSVRSTKHRGPFKLIHKEGLPTRSAARMRENQLKRYKDTDLLLKRKLSPSSSLV